LGQSIADGATAPSVADATDFGGVPLASDSATHTFTIANTGNADLHLSGSPRVSILGADPQDFIVIAQPSATVAGGGSTTFQVVFHPTFPATAMPLRQAIISIDNDDASEHPYTFEVQGTAIDTATNHNAALPQDVNGDHAVTSSDLLLVINRLNSQSDSSVLRATPLAATAAAPAGGSGKAYFCDVDGDGRISPVDALMVINYLLQHSHAQIAAPTAAPAAQAPSSTVTSTPAAQLFAAVDQAHSQMGASTDGATPPSAAPVVVSAPAAVPASPPPATVVTLSPSAVRLILASSAKKPGEPADDSLGELGG
jgi:hypothetical protein